jgi:hypothetical protein
MTGRQIVRHSARQMRQKDRHTAERMKGQAEPRCRQPDAVPPEMRGEWRMLRWSLTFGARRWVPPRREPLS